MLDYMKDSLRKFISENHVKHLESQGSVMWKCEYKEAKQRIKPVMHVVFSRYQGTEITETVVGNVGYVLALPSYWVDVDATALLALVGQYIDAYINEYVDQDLPDDGSGGNSDGNHCHCPPCPIEDAPQHHKGGKKKGEQPPANIPMLGTQMAYSSSTIDPALMGSNIV